MKRPTVKHWCASALVVLGLVCGGQVAASPAQDLFTQAAYYVALRYYGYSEKNLETISDEFQPQLDAVCANNENCPYETARPVVAAMIASLQDGHTYYLTPERSQELLREAQGFGSGAPRLGLSFREHELGILVSDVQAGGPADRAGVRRGDQLVSVADQAIGESKNALAAIGRLVLTRKPFALGFVRAGQSRNVKVTGEVLPMRLPTLRAVLGKTGVGQLRIPDFGFTAFGVVGSSVHRLVNEANRQNMKHLVIDLRDNPGGAVVETLAALGAFLPSTGFSLETREGAVSTRWSSGAVQGGFTLGSLVPLVRIAQSGLYKGRVAVLVNAQSYSGAEYFAQLMQDAKRAVVLGEETGGLCNTATNPIVLLDNSWLLLTTARSIREDGRPLPERVTPDVLLPDDLALIAQTGKDALFDQAVAQLLAR